MWGSDIMVNGRKLNVDSTVNDCKVRDLTDHDDLGRMLPKTGSGETELEGGERRR